MMLEQESFIETKVVGERRVESTLRGRINLPKGCKLYKYCPRENKMEVVQLKTLTPLKSLEPIVHQAHWDVTKLYCVAINEVNAAKKFARQMLEYFKQK